VSGALYTAHADDSDEWDNEGTQDTPDQMESEEVTVVNNHYVQDQTQETKKQYDQSNRRFYGTMMNNPKDEESPDPGEPVIP